MRSRTGNSLTADLVLAESGVDATRMRNRSAPLSPGWPPAPWALALTLAALLSAPGCREAPSPPYTRLAGPAPAVGEATQGPVLIAFWATWCGPCVEELPSLRALAGDPPARVRVVSFAEEEDPGALQRHFAGPPPVELGVVLDLDRSAAAAFGVDALPAAFLVVDGRLVAHFDGPRDWNGRPMRSLLTRLVNEALAVAPERGPGRSR